MKWRRGRHALERAPTITARLLLLHLALGQPEALTTPSITRPHFLCPSSFTSALAQAAVVPLPSP